jgi:hypothetical protein
MAMMQICRLEPGLPAEGARVVVGGMEVIGESKQSPILLQNKQHIDGKIYFD